MPGSLSVKGDDQVKRFLVIVKDLPIAERHRLGLNEPLREDRMTRSWQDGAGMGPSFVRMLLLAITIACGVWSAGAAESPDREPTSLLLVTLDTTRADHLGCYGAERAATPNLDALAREGVRFDQAISPAPLTLPSHASLFTGMVPRRHGVRNNSLFRLGDDPELLAAVASRHGYRTAAFVSSRVLDRIAGLDRGFDHYDDSVRVGAREAFNYEERAAVQTNDAVMAYLDRVEAPFFLWVHYFDPHLPYVPPEPYRARFRERPYDGEIAFMDEQFGKLLAAVRKRSSSLLVVVAGDHGESLGQHGEAAHGVFIYEATQRVPLIIAGPGVPQARVVGERVGLVDVAPTLLDLLGLPPLNDPDGHSLLPLIKGRKAATRSYELESLFPLYAYGWAPLRGLVKSGYKYVQAPRSELYRLKTDPGETGNLAAKEARRAAAIAAELQALTAGDRVWPVEEDPELAEQRRRLEALGYVSGGAGPATDATIDPKDGIAWIADLEAGRRAYQTGRPADGIEPLVRLLERNPRNVPALLALGVCYLGTGQPAMAVSAGRRALEIQPEDDLVRYNLANALSALSETKPEARAEARKHYAHALELNPRFADAYLNYASFLERDGADAAALGLLRGARAAGVRDPDLETRIAVLELKRGEVEPAKEAFRNSLALNPDAAGPLEALGRIAERQGKIAEAQDYYRRLLALMPPGDPGREALRRHIEQLSRPD